MTLRSRVIRLAAQNPDLRPFLLGILSQGASHPGEDMANQIASGLEWAHMVSVPVDGAPVGSARMAALKYPLPNVNPVPAGDRVLSFAEIEAAFRPYTNLIAQYMKGFKESWKLDRPAPTDYPTAQAQLKALEYQRGDANDLLALMDRILLEGGKAARRMKKVFPNATEELRNFKAPLSLIIKLKKSWEATLSLRDDRAKALAAVPAPVVDPKKAILSHVSEELRFMPKMSTGGRMRNLEVHEYGWTLEPEWRQRLDHYGNDGDGWDENGWEMDYAGPLREEAQKWLDKTFGPNHLSADVGEKGHLDIQPVGEWSKIFEK